MRSSTSIPSDILSAGQLSHARHAAVGTLQNFFCSLLALPTGILTAAFLTRRLGPVGYGQLTVTVSMVLWLEAVVSLGLSRAAVKLVAEAKDWRVTGAGFLRTQLLISTAAVLLLVALAPALADLMGDARLAGYLRMYALDIPVSALGGIYGAILVGLGLYGRRAILNGGFWLSRLGYVFLFVSLHTSVYGALAATLAASATILLGARLFVGPLAFRQFRLEPGAFLDYVKPLFLYNVAIQLFRILDLCFVKAVVVLPEAAGFFGAARNLAIVPGLLGAAFSPLLLAKVTELCGQGQEDYAKWMTRQAMRVVIWLLPFAAMTVGVATEVVAAIYGRDFIPAANVLSVLIFSAIGSTGIALCTSVLVAVGRPRFPLLLAGLALPLAVAGHWLLVPRYGMTGAAAVTTCMTWLMAVGMGIQIGRLWQVWPPLATLLRSGLVSVLAFTLSWVWPETLGPLPIKLASICAVIVAAFGLLGEVGRAEIQRVKEILFPASQAGEREGRPG